MALILKNVNIKFLAGLVFLKSIFWELLVVGILVFSINNFIGNSKKTIVADGIGYYDYLPSIFIHHDFNRRNIDKNVHPEYYERVVKLQNGYINYDDKFMINKYPCGTSILQAPFFFINYLFSAKDNTINDGYQLSYQRTVFYSALFYLFLALVFLRKTLQLYQVKKLTIVVVQLLLAIGTSITDYASKEASFSHVYSLFIISVFIYVVKSYFSEYNLRYFIWACLLLGIIFLLRNVNILIVLFVPFLAGSLPNLREGLRYIFTRPIVLLKGLLVFFLISSIQFVLFFIQVGEFFVDTYQNENFNFLDPHFIDILFSYRKGLFIYTPVLFISLFGLVLFTVKRAYYLLFSWLFFFLFLTYVLSSWWAWYYGGSYGLRAYIEFYPIFFILLALLIDRSVLWVKTATILISLLTIPVNIIQSYQYKEYILHWSEMDKEKYWKVFLKPNANLGGVVWKRKYDYAQFNTQKVLSVKDFSVRANSNETILTLSSKEIEDFSKTNIIQVLIDNAYNDNEYAKICLSITDSVSSNTYYEGHPYLLCFPDDDFNKYQTGIFNYEFLPTRDNRTKIIKIDVITGKEPTTLENVTIKFLEKR